MLIIILIIINDTDILFIIIYIYVIISSDFNIGNTQSFYIISTNYIILLCNLSSSCLIKSSFLFYLFHCYNFIQNNNNNHIYVSRVMTGSCR